MLQFTNCTLKDQGPEHSRLNAALIQRKQVLLTESVVPELDTKNTEILF